MNEKSQYILGQVLSSWGREGVNMQQLSLQKAHGKSLLLSGINHREISWLPAVVCLARAKHGLPLHISMQPEC